MFSCLAPPTRQIWQKTRLHPLCRQASIQNHKRTQRAPSQTHWIHSLKLTCQIRQSFFLGEQSRGAQEIENDSLQKCVPLKLFALWVSVCLSWCRTNPSYSYCPSVISNSVSFNSKVENTVYGDLNCVILKIEQPKLHSVFQECSKCFNPRVTPPPLLLDMPLQYHLYFPVWWFSRKVVSNSCDPMDCSLPNSFVHGILQPRVLEWVTISFPRGSSRPRNWTWVSCFAVRFFTNWAT